MIEPAASVFSFSEDDHLIRIHLKLGLEDVGFVVDEQDDTIHVIAPREASAV